MNYSISSRVTSELLLSRVVQVFMTCSHAVHFLLCGKPKNVPYFCPGFIPVCSLGMSQIGRMNLGKDASTFKYYTMCGLQEGFEPFAVNMKREITMWFSKRLPTFCNIPLDHMHVEVKYFSLIIKAAC